MQNAILLIYAGGTIGMVTDMERGMLLPFDFHQILDNVPELKRFDCHISSIVFDKPIDSSNMNIEEWQQIANIIHSNYSDYDGFVILQGTDTMAFTASALSFMLNNLTKPVILTGSQLPIGTLRTDGKENIITAIEIASAKKDEKAIVSEVCVLFEDLLMRGNRTTKHNAEHFDAIHSYNYPALANIGVHIKYNFNAILKADSDKKFFIDTHFDNRVAILKLFPGINRHVLEAFFHIRNLKAVILETYGSGNAPSYPWFIDQIKKAVDKGIIILNVTQCPFGMVDMKKYKTGRHLMNAGVINGKDMTTEAAVTKLMYLLGKEKNIEKVKSILPFSLKGEIS